MSAPTDARVGMYKALGTFTTCTGRTIPIRGHTRPSMRAYLALLKGQGDTEELLYEVVLRRILPGITDAELDEVDLPSAWEAMAKAMGHADVAFKELETQGNASGAEEIPTSPSAPVTTSTASSPA